ncbi:hypothetical protein AVEN_24012-1 [Araneus ventricosus]|uniref:Uncharacterized protein n=1 Tax=Araneus ventricosus TaxID=182803 RepID=A0A4Y2D008_ARAVE|nr:hypothetical protein AVEN_24012-1 [Araneus ventricosus]
MPGNTLAHAPVIRRRMFCNIVGSFHAPIFRDSSTEGGWLASCPVNLEATLRYSRCGNRISTLEATVEKSTILPVPPIERKRAGDWILIPVQPTQTGCKAKKDQQRQIPKPTPGGPTGPPAPRAERAQPGVY